MSESADIIEGKVREWRDVILRLQQLTAKDQGASILKVEILCIRGQPRYWFTPDKRNVEPASSARAFCDALDVSAS